MDHLEVRDERREYDAFASKLGWGNWNNAKERKSEVIGSFETVRSDIPHKIHVPHKLIKSENNV